LARCLTIVDGNYDTAKQMGQVENFLTQGMDAVVVLPVDTAATGPITKAVVKAGKPLVYVTRKPENLPKGVVYCGSWSIDAGIMNMEELGKTVMENWLASGDQIDGVASNNAEMAPGALMAIKAAGKLGKIPVGRTDGTHCGMPRANSTTSIPRVTSSSASSWTFPCSEVTRAGSKISEVRSELPETVIPLMKPFASYMGGHPFCWMGARPVRAGSR
jgi:ABC-type sugar transport system substrate-binding protein